MSYVDVGNSQRLYGAGSVVVKEGDQDDEIFILNHGKALVFKGEELIAQIKDEGVFLGEMSLILRGPRTATIKALSECTLTVYTGGLDKIVNNHPSIAKKLIKTLAERLKDTTDQFYTFKVRVKEEKDTK